MEANIGEALRAKLNAERKFAEKDFVGAKSYALKAQMLSPDLEGIDQMVVTYGVHCAAAMKINGEIDFYAILGLDSSADRAHVKKQYKKMAMLLHPDKNKTVGADGAFRLVFEAWAVLSDNATRRSYDHRRNLHSIASGNSDNHKSSASHARLDTFWTLCTTCQVQYEYLRKYVNKKLSCKNCRGVFTAIETGLGPVEATYPYYTWANRRENRHRSRGSSATYVPGASVSANNGVSGHGLDYASNLSFHWVPENSSGVLDTSRLSSLAVSQKEEMKGIRQRDFLKQHMKQVAANPHQGAKRGRPANKRNVEFEGTNNCVMEVAIGNANANPINSKLCPVSEACSKRSLAPAFDSRQLLIDKARTLIRKKLDEIKLVEEKKKALVESGESSTRPKREGRGSSRHQFNELRKTNSMTNSVCTTL